MYVYIYLSQLNCMGVLSLVWSHPQTSMYVNMPGRSSKSNLTNSALPFLRRSTSVDSTVTPARIKMSVVLKPRRVHLASKTEDTMHGGLPALRRSKRTTAGKKLDDTLEAEKELLPQLEPELSCKLHHGYGKICVALQAELKMTP